MPNIANYLEDLVRQKNALAANLKQKGVDASPNEKLNTLVPKVLDIVGGADFLPVLYPIEIKLAGTYLTITDSSNGKFGDGYIIYANGEQIYKEQTQEDTTLINLTDLTFPYVGDFIINSVIYDEDNFNNSAISNNVQYRMPGYIVINNNTAQLQVDYLQKETAWKSGTTVYLV